MQIPNDVLSQSAARLDFNPPERRRYLAGRNPIEVNDPQRIKTWLTAAAPERAQTEVDVMERIINGNDLMQINYLDIGVAAAKSVGRISIGNSSGQVIGFGTGFMVSPRLVLTNNHVLPDANTASRSFIRFNYQLDAGGTKTIGDDFDLDPASCFVTSKTLDFSLVAVKQTSEANTPLSKYGFLQLNATPGKTLDAQYLTIVQHPSGERKQIAIRENQLLKTLDNFLWYASDTAPGSSGSCVFNDTWQVVALHHSGVPDTVDIDGKPFTASTPENKIKWIANEGVRVSSIVKELQNFASVRLVKELLATLEGTQPESTLVLQTPGPGVSFVPLTDEKISIDPNYDNRHGYDPAFLGTGDKRIPLPKLSTELMKNAALKIDDDGHPAHVLTYHHYSLVMNKVRRLAYFTAVNIDGNLSRRLKREPDRWILDPRIAKEHQIGEALYANNDLDRGHLVRRLDPAWGETPVLAKVANDDTFHFTNCSPQHKDFNQGKNLWAGLEDYILDNTDNEDLKVTVLSGPIFGGDDEMYRHLIPLPKEFWKVVVMVKPNGAVSATGYVVSQASLIADLDEAAFAGFGKFKTFQVPIKRIADKTSLDFGKLPSFDPLSGGAHEAAGREAMLIGDYEQIVL